MIDTSSLRIVKSLIAVEFRGDSPYYSSKGSGLLAVSVHSS